MAAGGYTGVDEGGGEICLALSRESRQLPEPPQITVTEKAEQVVVDTGEAAFHIATRPSLQVFSKISHQTVMNWLFRLLF